MLELYKNIKKRREELGLSQIELAEMTGYTSKTSISKIESGSVDLSQSKIMAFAKALKVSPGQLMGWNEDSHTNETSIPAGFSPLPKSTTIPHIGQVACGDAITAEENLDGYTAVPTTWGATFTLTCRGDSMLPRILDGDLVAIRKQNTVENGQVAAVRIGDEATLKHVYIYPTYIELRPENPAFESIIKIGEEMADVHIEGIAVGLCRGL